jgi:hypothetical protein
MPEDLRALAERYKDDDRAPGILARGLLQALDTLQELCDVAELRGDCELPHPANDEKLWTARMQSAWTDAFEFLGKESPQ